MGALPAHSVAASCADLDGQTPFLEYDISGSRPLNPSLVVCVVVMPEKAMGRLDVARGLSDPRELGAVRIPSPRRSEWPYVGVVIATRDRPYQVRRPLESV